jgi:hypothetical protein
LAKIKAKPTLFAEIAALVRNVVVRKQRHANLLLKLKTEGHDRHNQNFEHRDTKEEREKKHRNNDPSEWKPLPFVEVGKANLILIIHVTPTIPTHDHN